MAACFIPSSYNHIACDCDHSTGPASGSRTDGGCAYNGAAEGQVQRSCMQYDDVYHTDPVTGLCMCLECMHVMVLLVQQTPRCWILMTVSFAACTVTIHCIPTVKILI
jgi:hypothetical protein